MTWGRRGVLLAGAGLLARPARAAPQAPAIRPAAAFVDSVGVCAHIGSEPYASGFAHFRELLGASGIRHLRDELRPGNDLDRWRDLNAAFGVRFNLLVSPATNTVPEMLDYLRALGPQRVSAIEGQNEGDSDWFMAQPAARFNWSATVVAYQREVFRALRQHHPDLPVLSPSVIDWKPADVRLIRRAAEFCDAVAIHPYVQHGQEPETGDDAAALSWYLRHMRDAFKPGAPVMATEAGYCNLVRPGGSGVSEAAAAIYLPRLLLHNFAAGVQRSFIYEFMDGGTNPADGEDHWGLVGHDGTPKPSFHAVRRLLAGLGDGGAPGGAARPIMAAIQDAGPDLRSLMLRLEDGRLVLALWQAVRCWDPVRAVDLTVPPVRIVIAAQGAAAAEAMRPNDGTPWTELPAAAGAVSLEVGAKVVLVRLRGQAG